ncbi:MAG: DNA polymerase I [Candidatus Buchananbacteria bacterium]
MSTKKQKLVVIDSNALVHRAFHALPPTMTDGQGRPTNAVYGFTTIFLKSIKDLKPDYIAACFDMRGKTFRHEQYTEYKATRTKAPDELYEQIPLVKEVLKAFGVPIFELSGFEADDLIGTICELKTVDRPDIDTIVLTGDQDCLQLVDYNTFVLSPHKGLSETILYGEQEVKEKFGGLMPKQLIDYKSLRGDPSDNIPGVKGIGEKGAIDLLLNFQTLEGIYKHIDSDKIKDRTRELLKTYKDNAVMSKELATINKQSPIDFKLADCKFSDFDQNAVVDLFQELGFKRLMTQVAGLAKSGMITPTGQGSLFDRQKPLLTSPFVKGRDNSLSDSIKDGDNSSPPFRKGELEGVKSRLGTQDYELITSETLEKFLTDLKKLDEFCFDTETTGLNAISAALVGISFCWSEGIAYYLPVTLADEIKSDLEKLFLSQKIRKIGHNLKYDIEIMNTYFGDSSSPLRKGRLGGVLNGIYFDTMVASYLINPGHRQHSLDTLAFVEFGYQMQPISDLIGTGKDQINMSEVPLDKISWYACEDADITYRLYLKYKADLAQENLSNFFDKLEMPLVEVLASIERNGVKINDKFLTDLSHDFAKRIKAIEKKAWKIADAEFNLASPKQLKEILFDKLEISTAGIGKTKTGLSTAAGQLEKLQGQHPIIDLIIEFRELSKLKSTYLDALPALINPIDGRVHTSFNQTVTSTGRLSSSEPNLQNIPIRTETGQQIRKAFIAEKGMKIVKADYSQIELRIIASLADDKAMLEIFESGGDIHTMTAALINNIKPKEVTKEIRRTAKEINFGVLYGMGAWGLSSRTGISNSEAQKFIFKYFDTFKEVKKWLEETVVIAKEKGYVESLYGRRRYLPEINSSIQQVASAAERMAVNMPIQATAADLIKLAMVEIYKKLPEISPKSRMILQVHDELVFEVPDKEIKKVSEFIRETMCGVMELRAPIEAEVSAGDNWGETKIITN